MQAFLLAAGYGSRLKPLTDNIPKCLVPIKGRPLLSYWINKLEKVNIKNITINTHHLHEQVVEFLKTYKHLNIKITFEEALLGTAGSFISNLENFEDDLLLAHADNYFDDDLFEFINAHKNRPSNCTITVMTFISSNPHNCGIFHINSKGVVESIYEKIERPPGNIANAAVYIIPKDFFNYFKTKYPKAKDFVLDILKNEIGKIYTYPSKGIFLDIGTFEDYLKVK